VEGTFRGLSFSESIYFSINTISTVGYGDIIPYSNFARLLSTLEVFCGIMLLLFGVRSCLSTRETIAEIGVAHKRWAGYGAPAVGSVTIAAGVTPGHPD
jgi:hypothetical protein